MERFSPIYISRNHNNIIFANSIFTYNIGTFGGAIFVNEPDFSSGTTAYTIMSNCTFTNNMAYLSGGAVYVRSVILESDLPVAICAGVHILNSVFTMNMGLVKSNGGAVTLFCD